MWYHGFGMSVRSITLAAFLLVIGCATKEGQPTAARNETGVGASELQEVGSRKGGLRYSDHVNPASYKSSELFNSSLQRIGDSCRKKKSPFVATQVTSRNAPAVIANIRSEPKS